eukprot:854905-Karenia_brevis.AAC.1
MAPGTTGSEGAHFDLKGWGHNVLKQTRERAEMVLKLWVMSNMLFVSSTQMFTLTSYDDRVLDYNVRTLCAIQYIKSDPLPDASELPKRRQGLGQKDVRKTSVARVPI